MQARDQARDSEGVRETKKETGLSLVGSVHWAHPTRLVQGQGDRAAVARLNFGKKSNPDFSTPQPAGGLEHLLALRGVEGRGEIGL